MEYKFDGKYAKGGWVVPASEVKNIKSIHKLTLWERIVWNIKRLFK